MQRPPQWTHEAADRFTHGGVVEAYRHRPPYPAETFSVLAGLMAAGAGAVLDVGCGPGNLARPLCAVAERVDALDPSAAMLALGKTLPGGDDPRLRWLHGRAENAPLAPPYALVTAGASLHWMDSAIVLPRFADALAPGGVLARVETQGWPENAAPEFFAAIIPRYSLHRQYEPFNLMAQLETHGLFEKRGEHRTAPVPFTQSLDDFIECKPSMSSFDRDEMPPADAAAFDAEVRAALAPHAPDGTLTYPVATHIVWGVPKEG